MSGYATNQARGGRLRFRVNYGFFQLKPGNFAMKRMDDCVFCEGTGKCEECKGTGTKPLSVTGCPNCSGTGKCPECEGIGKSPFWVRPRDGSVLIYGLLCAAAFVACFGLMTVVRNRIFTIICNVVWLVLCGVLFSRSSQRKKAIPPSRF
jgi:hypothetical protein